MDEEEATLSGTAAASGPGSIAVGAVGRDVHIVQQAAVPGPAAVVTRLSGDPGELFVGRGAQTRRLLDLLEAGTGAAVVVGMGGVGKTALVRRVAADALGRGWFDGGVFFVDLHGYDSVPVRPRQVFASLLRVLDVPAADIPPTADEQAAVYHQVLDRLADAGQRVLLVLDNASAADQVRDLLPRHHAHQALVTTRDTLGLPGTHRFDLDVLTGEDAVRLLTQVLAHRNPEDPRLSADPAAAARLVTICGALPLAVRITASVLADEPRLGVGELVAELTAADGPGVHRTEHGEETVSAVFDQSWHRLRRRKADAAAMLPLLTLNPGPDFATDAAAALAGTSPAAAAARLRTLRAASLLQQTPTGRWQLHDLIHLCAQHHLTPEAAGAAIPRLFQYYIDAVIAADRGLGGEPGERFPHPRDALAWLDAERANLTAAVVGARVLGINEFAFLIGTHLTEYLEWQRHLTDWLLVTDHATRAATAIGDPQVSAIAWNNFGVALEQARRHDDALRAHRQALALFQETGDRSGEAASWSNLGNALLSKRRIDEAIEAHRHTLDLCRTLGDDAGQGRAWANLALALFRAQRHEEALEAHRQALRWTQESDDRHHEAQIWNNLGNVFNELKRFDEAIDAYTRAGEMHRDAGDRYREAEAGTNLGTVLRQVSRFDEAIEAHQRAIHHFRQIGDHRSEGMAWFNLAFALGPARSVEEAKSAWETAARLFREAGDDESLAETLRWLEAPG
ncbi:tetratricopeptide repeat protein [Amycolatopsis sp. MtRt-6]|uniref:tetratricopeptide repeat protein n=1 Tax=Amycolatopsis sp. MtRt-6 TaxID=2792782 RepID=UPI001A8F08ED|nr:tetratricopeptide repeat protein [Amycolatopsis sp. MtRt-6]